MSESELARLLSDVQKLRHGYQLQRWLLVISFVMIALLASMIFGRSTSSVMGSTTDKDGILHVRGLVVEDGNQHERVRLGAPVPDPMIHGVRYKRSGAVSGLIISDAEGNEAATGISRALGMALIGWRQSPNIMPDRVLESMQEIVNKLNKAERMFIPIPDVHIDD